MRTGLQHFPLHRNRWRKGVSNQQLPCGSRKRLSGRQPQQHERGFALPRRLPPGLSRQQHRARRAGRARTLLPAPGLRAAPAPPMLRGHRPGRDKRPPSGPPRPVTGPASPRPGKARPPPHTDGLGPRPTGPSRRSGARRLSPQPTGSQRRRRSVPRPAAARCGPSPWQRNRHRPGIRRTGSGTRAHRKRWGRQRAAPAAAARMCEGFPLGGRQRCQGSARRPGPACPARALGRAVDPRRAGRPRVGLGRPAAGPSRAAAARPGGPGHRGPSGGGEGGRGDPARSCTGQAVRRGRGFTLFTEKSGFPRTPA